jgi:hypothetical protein
LVIDEIKNCLHICASKKIIMKNIAISLLAFNCCLIYSCEKDSVSQPDELTVISATGDIQNDVKTFRSSLGPLNSTPDVTGGHREINWDGLPASMEKHTVAK